MWRGEYEQWFKMVGISLSEGGAAERARAGLAEAETRGDFALVERRACKGASVLSGLDSKINDQ